MNVKIFKFIVAWLCMQNIALAEMNSTSELVKINILIEGGGLEVKSITINRLDDSTSVVFLYADKKCELQLKSYTHTQLLDCWNNVDMGFYSRDFSWRKAFGEPAKINLVVYDKHGTANYNFKLFKSIIDPDTVLSSLSARHKEAVDPFDDLDNSSPAALYLKSEANFQIFFNILLVLSEIAPEIHQTHGANYPGKNLAPPKKIRKLLKNDQ